MLGQATTGSPGATSGILAGVALVIGALGAAAGGIAAIVAAARNRQRAEDARTDTTPDNDADYSERLWTEMRERVDRCQDSLAAETRRADRAELAYQECNAERLRLLRRHR